jgi:hypothetical protein
MLRVHGVPLEECADQLASKEWDEVLYTEHRDTVAAMWVYARALNSAA